MKRLLFAYSLIILSVACLPPPAANTTPPPPAPQKAAPAPEPRDPYWDELENTIVRPKAIETGACTALSYIDSELARSLLVRCLAPLLLNPNADVDFRREAIKTIVDANAKEGIEFLQQMLSDSSVAIRGKAAEGLLRLGSPSGVKILLAYNSGYNEDRRGAFWLARFITRVPKATLLQEIGSKNKSVRRSAAILLGLLGGDDALKALSQLTNDRDKETKAYAELAQTYLLDPPALLERLAKDLSSRGKVARFAAVEALGYYGKGLGFGEVHPLLTKALKDKDTVVQTRAVESLLLLGGAESSRILANRLSSADGVLKGRILQALGEIKEANALDTVLSFAQTAEMNSRGTNIANCLIAYGSPRGREFAKRLLGSKLPHIRHAGARVLAALGSADEAYWRPLLATSKVKVQTLLLIAAAKGGTNERTFQEYLQASNVRVRTYAIVSYLIAKGS